YKKSIHGFFGYAELFHHDSGVIFPGEVRLDFKLRIYETNIFELNDGIGNLFTPVLAACFHHAHWKTVKRNIKQVFAIFTEEPRGKATQFIMGLKEEDIMTIFPQNICGRHSGKT